MGESDERLHRKRLWAELSAHDLGDLEPKLLRDLGIYGGAQGIWVDKARTGPLTRSGAGATVSILHTGKHYPDDLSGEGVIYHNPTTARPPGRDAAEVEATKETRALGVPLFVILPGDRSPSRRRVRLGWVEDWDDASRQFLILFGDEKPTSQPAPEPDAPFVLTDEQPLGEGGLFVGAPAFTPSSFNRSSGNSRLATPMSRYSMKASGQAPNSGQIPIEAGPHGAHQKRTSKRGRGAVEGTSSKM
jgi:hypothetical protein